MSYVQIRPLCLSPGIEKPTMSWTGRFYSFEGDPNYLDRWLQRYYTYEPLRESITNVSNYNYQGVLSSYSYDNDTLGRRTNRVDVTPSLTLTNVFGYNAKSEVTRAMMGDNTYGYDYDSIGNRIQSAVAVGSGQALTNTYAANALNQYTQIDLIPPPSSILPKYDLDGNMITNGVWSYTWDAENRMVSACSNGLLLITNRYDDQSRRIAKIVSLGGTEIQRNTFVYDGWNLIRELRVQGSGVSTNYYCWGPDLSGSLQGAGGVGGLQAVIVVGETPATYYTCYDANGNITAYVDELGNAYAEYSYDAFGNPISQSGDLASTFSHRFSTKYADDETGLYYYGYRYYAPGLGRWVSRDPIGEQGGVNVYGFVGNDSINSLDILGNFAMDLEPGAPPAHLVKLLEHLAKLDLILPALLDQCNNSKCVCDSKAKKQCEEEAKKIAARIRSIFVNNYDSGLDDPALNYIPKGQYEGDMVGNHYCWTWARNFYSELMALKPMQFTFFHARNKGTANHNGIGPMHYFVHIYVGNRRDPAGKRDPACALTLDDNWQGKNGFIHKGLIPPTSSGAGWGKHEILGFHEASYEFENL